MRVFCVKELDITMDIAPTFLVNYGYDCPTIVSRVITSKDSSRFWTAYDPIALAGYDNDHPKTRRIVPGMIGQRFLRNHSPYQIMW